MDLKIAGLEELIEKLDSATNPTDQRRRILAAHCPIHDKHPTNVRKSGDEWTMAVCCDRLTGVVAEAMHGLA